MTSDSYLGSSEAGMPHYNLTWDSELNKKDANQFKTARDHFSFVILMQNFESKILYDYKVEKWYWKYVFVKYFIIPILFGGN